MRSVGSVRDFPADRRAARNRRSSLVTLIAPFLAEQEAQLGLFTDLRRQLESNFLQASGVTYQSPNHKLVTPEEHTKEGYTPHEIAAARTATRRLRRSCSRQFSIPFSFTDRQRYEHMHVVGGSGYGSPNPSSWQRLILEDLQRERPPALVIIDSQGEMLRKLQQLELFAPGQPPSGSPHHHRPRGRRTFCRPSTCSILKAARLGLVIRVLAERADRGL